MFFIIKIVEYHKMWKKIHFFLNTKTKILY